jgi:hypothetical protein
MARKAKNSQLKRHTHKGRKSSTGRGSGTSGVEAQGGRGVRMTGFRGDPREAAQAMTRISPTPHGPEPHWPGGS